MRNGAQVGQVTDFAAGDVGDTPAPEDVAAGGVGFFEPDVNDKAVRIGLDELVTPCLNIAAAVRVSDC